MSATPAQRRLALVALLLAPMVSELAEGRERLKTVGTSLGSAQETAPGPMPVFEFHSGFWINLHHFLYQQARLAQTPAQATVRSGHPEQNEPGRREARTASPEELRPVSTAALTQEEQQAWAAALAYYAENISRRDLLFNLDMVNIKNRLAEMESCADLSGHTSGDCASGLREELIAALERAAPVYRARWWAEHDRANRSWTGAVVPMVRQMGGELARQLAALYRADWPAGPIRVDVVNYAGPFGAYTSLDSLHVTLSSSDTRNQGLAALEVLFHEASHPLARSVYDAIVRECRARSKPIPRDLWHALLFYTTGEIVKRALSVPDAAGRAAPADDASAGRGPSRYTPYAYRYGLYARGWSHYQRLLERYWQPYLDGKAEFDAAVARLVSAL